MVKSMIEKEISRMEKEFRRIESEIKEEIEKYNVPLYSFYESEDFYYYLIDIPNVDISTIYVKVENNNSLKISCKDKSNKEYVLNVKVPEDADIDSLSVTRVKWLVKITVKRRKD